MTARLRFPALLALLMVVSVAGPEGQIPPPPPAPPGQLSSPPQGGTGFIAGQVVDSTSGRPIPDVMVGLTGRPAAPGGRGSAVPAIVTDPQGRFYFRNLAPGVYTLQSSKAGYSPTRVGIANVVELGDGERLLDVRIRLARLGSIAGTVRDTAGDPVVGSELVALRRTVLNGRVTFGASVRGIKTDDRGAYRFPRLTPGEYVICACARDPNPFDPLLLTTLASEPVNLMSVAARALTVGADVVSIDDTLRTYAPTFHPNSQSVSRATRVTLGAGEEKTGVDITAELVRATRVSGRIVGAESSVNAAAIRLVPLADAEVGMQTFLLQPMLVQPDGRFDFAPVPPGQYRLMVTHRETGNTGGAPSGVALGFAGARAASPPAAPVAIAGPGVNPPPVLWANEIVTVPDSGIKDLVVSLSQAPVVTGRLQFVGSAPPPTEQSVTRSDVYLQQITSGMITSAASGSVAANGSFKLVGSVPGKYLLSYSGAPGYQTLKSVTLAGLDITDLPLEIGAKDLTDVVLTFVDVPLGALTATAAIPPNQPEDDQAVVVFPADRKYWTDPTAALRRFRAAALSTKGTAALTGLPAGEYFVALVAGDDAVDWQESSKLDAFARRAQRVTITDGGRSTIEVRR